jgi:hypothetical protein
LRSPRFSYAPGPVVQDARLQPLTYQAQDALIADPVLQEPDQPLLVDPIEEASDVGIQYPVHTRRADADAQGVECIMLAAPGSEAVREAEEVFLVDLGEHRDHGSLDYLVFQCRDPQRALLAVRLGNELALDGHGAVAAAMDASMQFLEVALQIRLVVLPRDAVDPGRGTALERQERIPQQVDADVVQQCGELLLLPLPCGLPYAFQPR